MTAKKDPYRAFDPTARLDKHQRELNDAMTRIGKLEKLAIDQQRMQERPTKRFRRRLAVLLGFVGVGCLFASAACAEASRTYFCTAFLAVALLGLTFALIFGHGTWD